MVESIKINIKCQEPLKYPTRRIYILLITIVTCHDIEQYMAREMHSEKNNELVGKIIGHVKQIEEKCVKFKNNLFSAVVCCYLSL